MVGLICKGARARAGTSTLWKRVFFFLLIWNSLLLLMVTVGVIIYWCGWRRDWALFLCAEATLVCYEGIDRYFGDEEF